LQTEIGQRGRGRERKEEEREREREEDTNSILCLACAAKVGVTKSSLKEKIDLWFGLVWFGLDWSVAKSPADYLTYVARSICFVRQRVKRFRVIPTNQSLILLIETFGEVVEKGWGKGQEGGIWNRDSTAM